MSEPAPERTVRGYVYFFHSTTTKQTKIGQTRRYPRMRFDQIRNNVPGMSLDNAYAVGTDAPQWWESWFHEAFSHRREQGEWFNLTTRERALLKKLPDYISTGHEIPLAIHVRRIANRKAAAMKDGEPGAISMRLVTPIATLIQLMDVLPGGDSAEVIAPLLLAECERKMASLDATSQQMIRSVLGLSPN